MSGKPSAETIFAEAIVIASPDERAAYLDQTCRHDPGLRQAVEKLVADHFRAGPFLQQPAARVEIATLDQPRLERPGAQIGPYKLMEQIGEGGMGLVFVAEQHEPVRRKVALKVIKPGMDTRDCLARFEAERQALALMDHPNIARVLDAGVTGSDRPYFVMELVKGMPITQYSDDNRLTSRKRLELFAHVCHAVQHAHQKGIIHRDIKPTNVLVASHDGQPVVKVIDFGVAKAIGQQLTERTIYTALTQMIGTPLYMSPEQASMSSLDIDTRTDIYSLGVLLYELLTGTTPFDKERLKQAAYDEMRRIIREEEPQKPSTRISTSDAAPSIAAQRNTDPVKLSKLMRGEVDWIVMKALEKDRNRRYETANGFAMDVQRYLADEPVAAGPPSAAYRLRKFVRRNKGPVTAATLLLMSLIVGIAGTSLGLLQANTAWQAAVNAGNEKEEARKTAVANELNALNAAHAERLANQMAEDRLAKLENANAILTAIFRDLDLRFEEKGGKPLSAQLAERLNQAALLLEGEAVGNELTVARMQMPLGEALLSLGYYKEAIVSFIKARAVLESKLGPDHPESLRAVNYLALAYRSDGQINNAVPLFEQAFDKQKDALGLDHPDTLALMHNLARGYLDDGQVDKALPLFEKAFAEMTVRLGPNHRDTLGAMAGLARGYWAARQLDKAASLFEQTLERMKAALGPDHANTLAVMNSLAVVYQETGHVHKALPLLEYTHQQWKAKLGPDHPHTLLGMHNLAWAYKNTGQLENAVPLFEETLKMMQVKLGPDRLATLRTMSNLADSYRADGQLDKAVPLFEQTIQLMKATLGTDHPETLATMNNLALAFMAAGKLQVAVPLFEESLAKKKANLGPDHPDTLLSMVTLGAAQIDLMNYDAAEMILLDFQERVHRNAGALKPHYQTLAVPHLVRLYDVWGKQQQAAEWRKRQESQGQAEKKSESGTEP